MKATIQCLVVLLTVFYPLIVYFSLGRINPGAFAFLLVLLFSARASLASAASTLTRTISIIGLMLMIAISVFMVATDDNAALKWYPCFVSLTMFIIFIYSLIAPPSMVERLARIKEPNLSASGVAYTRKVTIAWCIFFVGNGAISLWTVLNDDWHLWTLYNGVISYLLVGLFFMIEFFIRQKVRARSETN